MDDVMAEGNQVRCGCNRAGWPLWGFCDDDLVCPQCGKKVAYLQSANRQRSDGGEAEIWIYPQKRAGFDVKQYTFPLSLCYADQGRRRQQRPPWIDFDRSVVDASPRFQAALAPLEHARSFHCRLIRSDQSGSQEPAPDEMRLPASGLKGSVTLMGDFGKRKFRLRICNAPQMEVALQGRGVEEVKRPEPAAGKSCEVIMSDALEVDLVLRALTAPVLVAEDLREIDVLDRDEGFGESPHACVSAQLGEPLRAGTWIRPGRPWTARLHLDTRQFRRPGQKCQLLLPLKTAIIRTPPLILDLVRVEKGRLAFWPNPLSVEVMYAGEIRSSAPYENVEGPDRPAVIGRLYVSNEGDEKIKLQRPRAVPGKNCPLNRWIDVAWAPAEDGSSPADKDGGIELLPGKQREIYVAVDLRSFAREKTPPCRSLSATIVVAEAGKSVDDRDVPGKVEFSIAEVRPREPLRRPLAIDFGNSHSYAAVWHPEPVTRRQAIVPTHDVQDPEHFPTAIFFHDISDPKRPDYVVGRQAADRAGALPQALVTDLKRWIGESGRPSLRNVRDAAGRSRPWEIDDLVRLYLKAVIQRAEAILRRYTITRIGVSYPARFNVDRRDAFTRLIRQFCEQSAEDPDLGPLDLADLDIDEANAVAIGFVFESEVQKTLLSKVVSQQEPAFVVASFDFGGGSVDTALLRFEVEDGDLRMPVFRSEYLGIGGDESFGGDNVTLAAMELLKGRVRKKLVGRPAEDRGVVAWLDRIPSPVQLDQAPSDLHRAYQALWAAAEEIKLFQSRHANGPAGEEEQNVFRHRLQELLINRFAAACGFGDMNALLRQALNEGIDRDEFLIGLDELYDHSVACDMTCDDGYSVRERLEKCVDELCSFAASRQVSIHFAVLGGSGCRLPLVSDMFARKKGQFPRELGGTQIVYDPDRTKCRVASGLARYLDIPRHSRHRFARSRDYTADAIGLRIPGSGEFLAIVPNCTPVHAPGVWHRFESEGKPLRVENLLPTILLYRQEDAARDRPLGWFCSELPSSPQQPSEAESPASETSPPLAKNACAEIRLVGSETQIEMRIVSGGRVYGPWPMQRGAPPAVF